MSSVIAPFQRKNSYDYDELIQCGHGRLFGPGNAQLPLPPMLMFDRIPHISDTGGAYGKGECGPSWTCVPTCGSSPAISRATR